MKDSESYVNKFFFLVPQIAEIRYKYLLKYGVKHIEKDELVSEGYLGLKKAADKFEPERETDFESFARAYINNAIKMVSRNEDTLRPEERAFLRKVYNTAENFRQKYGREVDDEDVVREILYRCLGREPTESEMKKKLAELKKIRLKNPNILSLNDSGDFEDKKGVKNVSSKEKSSEKKMVEKELAKATDDCLKEVLTKDEILTVLLNDLRYFSVREIAKILGTSYKHSRVNRMLKSAEIKLINCLKRKGYSVPDLKPAE